jgi:predicted glycosyltransferase
MAHYHSPKSEDLFWTLLHYLLGQPGVQIVVLPRTKAQGHGIMEKLGPRPDLLIPESVLHGPNLLWHADAMFGGGGTMNREAACLGVPAYSYFSGPLGAVDRHLSEVGKLTLLRSKREIQEIQLRKQPPRVFPSRHNGHHVLDCIVEHVLEVALT